MGVQNIDWEAALLAFWCAGAITSLVVILIKRDLDDHG